MRSPGWSICYDCASLSPLCIQIPRSVRLTLCGQGVALGGLSLGRSTGVHAWGAGQLCEVRSPGGDGWITLEFGGVEFFLLREPSNLRMQHNRLEGFLHFGRERKGPFQLTTNFVLLVCGEIGVWRVHYVGV